MVVQVFSCINRILQSLAGNATRQSYIYSPVFVYDNQLQVVEQYICMVICSLLTSGIAELVVDANKVALY